jgi:signal peptidase II
LIQFGVAAFTILTLDIFTKWAVSHFMRFGQSIPVLGDFGRLTYIRNPGAAFGLFSGSRVSFILISVVAIAIILSLLSREHYRGKWAMTALGMILGGAVGNLIDRIRLGEVTDFIDLGFGRTRWPVFNVADIGVTVGVCILAVALYVHGEHRKAEDQASPDAAPGGETEHTERSGPTESDDADEDDGRKVRPADSCGR